MANAKSDNIVTQARKAVVDSISDIKLPSSIRLTVEDWRRLDAAGERFGGLSRGETVELMLGMFERGDP